MQLEDRYIVIKRSDLAKLDLIRQYQLGWILTELHDLRARRGAEEDVQAVVIEKDWPEYEPTLKLLASRVDSE